MNFFRHVLKVALILGLIVGLVIFSVLLYVSDFEEKSVATADETAVAASPEAPVAAIGQPIEQRSLYWIFGEPDPEQAPSAPSSPPQEVAP